MGAREFTDLRVWQMANRLKLMVYAYTGTPPASHDRRYCEDTRAAIDSVAANIAEGFARYDHKEFAQFVKIAKSSLAETQSHILDARSRRYIPETAFQQMWSTSLEAMRSIVAFHAYLRTHPTPDASSSRTVR